MADPTCVTTIPLYPGLLAAFVAGVVLWLLIVVAIRAIIAYCTWADRFGSAALTFGPFIALIIGSLVVLLTAEQPPVLCSIAAGQVIATLAAGLTGTGVVMFAVPLSQVIRLGPAVECSPATADALLEPKIGPLLDLEQMRRVGLNPARTDDLARWESLVEQINAIPGHIKETS